MKKYVIGFIVLNIALFTFLKGNWLGKASTAPFTMDKRGVREALVLLDQDWAAAAAAWKRGAYAETAAQLENGRGRLIRYGQYNKEEYENGKTLPQWVEHHKGEWASKLATQIDAALPAYGRSIDLDALAALQHAVKHPAFDDLCAKLTAAVGRAAAKESGVLVIHCAGVEPELHVLLKEFLLERAASPSKCFLVFSDPARLQALGKINYAGLVRFTGKQSSLLYYTFDTANYGATDPDEERILPIRAPHKVPLPHFRSLLVEPDRFAIQNTSWRKTLHFVARMNLKKEYEVPPTDPTAFSASKWAAVDQVLIEKLSALPPLSLQPSSFGYTALAALPSTYKGDAPPRP